MDVVDLADDVGSTGHIIRAVQQGLPGSRWAIGTESRLVERLQQQHPDQDIRSLAEAPPFCEYMGKTTLNSLADVLENLVQGRIENQVTVDAETARWARLALERMLAA
jgi:quinolinate synthase